MRSPACTFSKVTSYTGSPAENGCSISWSMSRAVGVMSSSAAVTPSERISLCALLFVPSLVAKPGRVKARMSLRGRPARSMARAATISACVESRPPETPMTTFGPPMAASRC